MVENGGNIGWGRALLNLGIGVVRVRLSDTERQVNMWLRVGHLFLYKNTKRKVARRKERIQRRREEVRGQAKEGRKQPKKQRIGSDQRTQDE